MSKKRRMLLTTCCLLALLANGVGAFAQKQAQERMPPPPPPEVETQRLIMLAPAQAPEGALPVNIMTEGPALPAGFTLGRNRPRILDIATASFRRPTARPWRRRPPPAIR